MLTIIAATNFVGERPNGDRFPIHFRVAAPEQRANDEWCCTIQLSGLQDRSPPISGEDAVQSLCLALGFAHSLLRDFVRSGGRIRFAGKAQEEVPLEAYFGPFTTMMSPPAA